MKSIRKKYLLKFYLTLAILGSSIILKESGKGNNSLNQLQFASASTDTDPNGNQGGNIPTNQNQSGNNPTNPNTDTDQNETEPIPELTDLNKLLNQQVPPNQEGQPQGGLPGQGQQGPQVPPQQGGLPQQGQGPQGQQGQQGGMPGQGQPQPGGSVTVQNENGKVKYVLGPQQGGPMFQKIPTNINNLVDPQQYPFHTKDGEIIPLPVAPTKLLKQENNETLVDTTGFVNFTGIDNFKHECKDFQPSKFGINNVGTNWFNFFNNLGGSGTKIGVDFVEFLKRFYLYDPQKQVKPADSLMIRYFRNMTTSKIGGFSNTRSAADSLQKIETLIAQNPTKFKETDAKMVNRAFLISNILPDNQYSIEFLLKNKNIIPNLVKTAASFKAEFEAIFKAYNIPLRLALMDYDTLKSTLQNQALFKDQIKDPAGIALLKSTVINTASGLINENQIKDPCYYLYVILQTYLNALSWYNYGLNMQMIAATTGNTDSKRAYNVVNDLVNDVSLQNLVKDNKYSTAITQTASDEATKVIDTIKNFNFSTTSDINNLISTYSVDSLIAKYVECLNAFEAGSSLIGTRKLTPEGVLVAIRSEIAPPQDSGVDINTYKELLDVAAFKKLIQEKCKNNMYCAHEYQTITDYAYAMWVAKLLARMDFNRKILDGLANSAQTYTKNYHLLAGDINNNADSRLTEEINEESKMKLRTLENKIKSHVQVNQNEQAMAKVLLDNNVIKSVINVLSASKDELGDMKSSPIYQLIAANIAKDVEMLQKLLASNMIASLSQNDLDTAIDSNTKISDKYQKSMTALNANFKKMDIGKVIDALDGFDTASTSAVETLCNLVNDNLKNFFTTYNTTYGTIQGSFVLDPNNQEYIDTSIDTIFGFRQKLEKEQKFTDFSELASLQGDLQDSITKCIEKLESNKKQINAIINENKGDNDIQSKGISSLDTIDALLGTANEISDSLFSEETSSPPAQQFNTPINNDYFSSI